MTSSQALKRNIQQIQGIFQGASAYMENAPNAKALRAYVQAVEAPFRGIALEAISMEISRLHLSQAKQPYSWDAFYQDYKQAYSSHLEVGVGWSVAMMDRAPAPLLNSAFLLPDWLVYEGMGYCHALFRQKRCLRQQQYPKFLNEIQLTAYDQGVGRRLWYQVAGNLDRLRQIVTAFAVDRQPHLWRGIGLACAFVGGLEEGQLLALKKIAMPVPLRCGVLMALHSRLAASCLTTDIAIACQVICNQSIEDAQSLLAEINIPSQTANIRWLKAVETAYQMF